MADERKVRADVLEMYKTLAKALGRDISAISEASRLWEDLRFTAPIRAAMSDPLSGYTALYKAKRILRSEAKSFKKIKDAADLVLKLIKEKEKK